MGAPYHSYNSVVFTDVDNGYIACDYGLILKTADGGSTWAEIPSGTSNSLHSICFPDPNTGYAAGDNGTILKTTDAGLTWHLNNSGTNENLYSVYFTTGATGYTVGYNGIVLKTTDGGDWVQDKQRSGGLIIYPDPANDFITIEQSGGTPNGQLTILDVNGKEYIKQQVCSGKTNIDIRQLSCGLYFVRLTNEKTVMTGKMLKEY